MVNSGDVYPKPDVEYTRMRTSHRLAEAIFSHMRNDP